MSFKSDFKVYDNPNPQKGQSIKWANEVLIEKNKQPRQENVSPLLEWWLSTQNDS